VNRQVDYAVCFSNSHPVRLSHYIETVWGRGFVLCDPAATSATQKCGEEDLSGDL
jgi:hypothetical protein